MQLRAIRVIPGTKITHDEWSTGESYSYEDLVARKIPAVGIPAALNDLIIIDVDAGGEAHKYDGREEWAKFAQEAGIPETYTVATANGGYHFYFKLPKSVNKLTFKPVRELFKGVDVVFNGFVRCPPTPGFEVIYGDHSTIAEAPVSLLRQVLSRPIDVVDLVGATPSVEQLVTGVHPPLTQNQLDRLKGQIEWVQLNGDLSYDQWYRGLVSLKSGIPDEDTLHEFALLWTRNKSWREGDDEQAFDILKRTDRFGGIGPGTIFELVKEIGHNSGEDIPAHLITQKDAIERANVPVSISKQGLPVVQPNETNICAIIGIIQRFKKENLYFDTRMDSFILDGKQVDNTFITNVLTPILQSRRNGLGFDNFRRAAIQSAVEVLMDSRRIDPHIEWLEQLKWDGVPRIDAFFPRYVMTSDTDYTRTLGRNLWIALAARGLDPGCKMDNIIIIEGKEGIKKSTLVEAIGGRYYLSLANDDKLNSSDALRRMHQSTVVEVPELINLINREGESVKAILTTSKDKLRDLYASKAFDRRRGFIIIGTSNSGEYLTDAMGKRRFWPVRIDDSVDGLDIAALKVDRAQLFAEGVARYKKGESYWEVPKAEWLLEVDARRVKDPLAPVVEDILQSGFASGIQAEWKTEEIYNILNTRELLVRGLTKRVADRIEAMLRECGAVKKQINREGRKLYRWVYGPAGDIVADLI